MSAEGFRDHVTTAGSLLEVACGWSVVQLGHDVELGPMHGCTQRWKAIGLNMVHVGNKGITDGQWSGEMKCIGPRAKDGVPVFHFLSFSVMFFHFLSCSFFFFFLFLFLFLFLSFSFIFFHFLKFSFIFFHFLCWVLKI